MNIKSNLELDLKSNSDIPITPRKGKHFNVPQSVSSSDVYRKCSSLPITMPNRTVQDLKKKSGISVNQRLNTTESMHPADTSPSNFASFRNETRTKSLQDLQTDVDALIDFQNIVIETFPDLKTKMMSIRSKRNQLKKKKNKKKPLLSTSAQESSFLSPVEVVDETVPPFFFRNRSYSICCRKEPKSGEGSGCTVQDSGFSTETNSSKDGFYAPAASAGLQGANASNRLACDSDDELLNLLDVICRKTLKFRQIFSSLPHIECEKSATFTSSGCMSNIISSNSLHPKILRFNVNYQLKQNILRLNKERDILLLKVAELESELVKNRLKIFNMDNQLNLFTSKEKKLQEQLEIDLNQDEKCNFTLYPRKCDSASRICVSPKSTVKLQHKTYQDHHCSKFLSGKKNVNKTFPNVSNEDMHASSTKFNLGSDSGSSKNDIQSLGKFDGLLSSPKYLCKVREVDSDKIAAILLETNPLELQRHLITLTVEKQGRELYPEKHGPKSIPLIKKQSSSKLSLQRTDNTSDYNCNDNTSLSYFNNFKHVPYENAESVKIDNSMVDIYAHDREINELKKHTQLSKRLKPSKIPLFDSKTFHSTKAIQKSLSLSTGNIYFKNNKSNQQDSLTLKNRGPSTYSGPKILSVSSIVLDTNRDLENEKFFHLESPEKPPNKFETNEYIQTDKQAESITQLIPNKHSSNPLITFSIRDDTKEKVNSMHNSTKIQVNESKEVKTKVDTQNKITYLTTQPSVQMLIGGVTKSSYRNLIKKSSNNNSMAEDEIYTEDHIGRVNNLRSALLGWLKI